MSRWLLQANPARWPVHERFVEGESWPWELRTAFRQVRAGDTAAIWMSAGAPLEPIGGLLGFAEFVEDPAQVAPQDPNEKPTWRATLRFGRRLDPVLARERVLAEPALASLPVARFRNAGVYRLSDAQWDALVALADGVPPGPRGRSWFRTDGTAAVTGEQRGRRREAVGEAIRRRRAELGLSRRELAERAGISYPYVWELEQGRKPGSTQALAEVAESLELRPHELLELAERVTSEALPEAARAPGAMADDALARVRRLARRALRAVAGAPAEEAESALLMALGALRAGGGLKP